MRYHGGAIGHKDVRDAMQAMGKGFGYWRNNKITMPEDKYLRDDAPTDSDNDDLPEAHLNDVSEPEDDTVSVASNSAVLEDGDGETGVTEEEEEEWDNGDGEFGTVAEEEEEWEDTW